jgi:putative acetyltransferase
MISLEVRRDDLSSPEVQALVREHMSGMMNSSPPESVHALPLDALRKPDITFWAAWLGAELCGCGALKAMDSTEGEVKSMRTRPGFLRQGVGQAVLSQIMQEAKARGYQRLNLETGSTPPFDAALALYLRNGFEICGPFGDYQLDPFSVYMTKLI